MNARLRRKWTTALRSGKYEQGMADLCVLDEGAEQHCCLGVLLDEAVPEFFQAATHDYRKEVHERGRPTGESSYIPDDLAVLWGLDEVTQARLADMNDDSVPFPEIADWIDENL